MPGTSWITFDLQNKLSRCFEKVRSFLKITTDEERIFNHRLVLIGSELVMDERIKLDYIVSLLNGVSISLNRMLSQTFSCNDF